MCDLKNTAFLKAARCQMFVILIRVALRWRWEWSIGEIILKGENQSICSQTCPSATLSTINTTWTSLGFIPGLHRQRLATNSLRHGTWRLQFIETIITNKVGTSQEAHWMSIMKKNWLLAFRKIMAIYCEN